MTPEEAQIKHAVLTNDIERHQHLYYVLDAPEISDAEFDGMMLQLRMLEKEFPELVTPDSPTQKVGGRVSTHFSTVKHAYPMLSLDNLFNGGEVHEWLSNLPYGTEVACEYKLDGVSLSLTYENGILTKAVTRGDGEVGEDVTINAVQISGIPRYLKHPITVSIVTIRGEVFVHKSVFEDINGKIKAEGGKPFANERNYASGSLRQKNPDITKERRLSFMAYSVQETSGILASHNEAMNFCKVNGFIPVTRPETFTVQNFTRYDIDKFLLAMEAQREELDVVIDGLVFKVCSYEQQKKLGSNAHHPHWATAYKFPAAQVVTTLEAVDWQIGRTGNLTPVARVTPVHVHGVVVSNVTLHNADQIKHLDLGIGNRIIIERRGDVIPKVMCKDQIQTNPESPIVTPTHCPYCGTPVMRRTRKVGKNIEPSAIIYCPNKTGCTAQLKERLSYFVGTDGLDIEDFGPETVSSLVESGKLTKMSDIFLLKEEDISELEGFTENSAYKLTKNIKFSLTCSQVVFLRSLGIEGCSTGTCKRLIKALGSIDKVYNAYPETLEMIRDIGPDTAQSIYDWISDNKDELDLLLSFRFKFYDVRNEVADELKGTFTEKALGKFTKRNELFGPYVDRVRQQWIDWGLHESCGKAIIGDLPLTGQTWVLTGEFIDYTRNEATELLEGLGAKVTGSVSKNTTGVVAGSGAGSKVQKATSLGIPVKDEQFLKELAKI